ncbi:unnamed protein product [Spirodela intermedia]|uniref:Uncharacterized protein n=1 Tax=Spirodela intermedia TaxID=51605 RepID=A0A7I8LJE1_SPIIN|nr:unnamed protein product [Spirodela intermedia]
MRFTDSPAVELSVGGAALSIQQDNGSLHVGTSVWPCSLVLVKFIERWFLHRRHLPPSSTTPYADLLHFEGKRAVELGAGCGAAGMGLHLLGLDVVLTDIAPVMPALRRNLKRNRAALGRPPRHAIVYWNNAAQISALRPPFDFVVAADVVYIEDSVAPLVAAMEALVSPRGAVLLGYQVRSPEAHRLFWEICGRSFSVQKVAHEDLHPDYAYEEADVYVLRKK